VEREGDGDKGGGLAEGGVENVACYGWFGFCWGHGVWCLWGVGPGGEVG